MKFKIGDSVIFKMNYSYNDDIKYDKTKSYVVVDTNKVDVFIDIDPKRPLYHERFLLDTKKMRIDKLKKISGYEV